MTLFVADCFKKVSAPNGKILENARLTRFLSRGIVLKSPGGGNGKPKPEAWYR